MRRLFVLCVALWLLTVPVSAQTSLTVTIAQPFTVTADYTTNEITTYQVIGFRLKEGATVVQTQPVAAFANGSIRFSFPTGLSATGNHTYTAVAYNATAESPASSAVTLTVILSAPVTPPSNIRITTP